METNGYFNYKLLPVSRNLRVAAAKLPQSCPTLGDLTDGSPPGSPVPERNGQLAWPTSQSPRLAREEVQDGQGAGGRPLDLAQQSRFPSRLRGPEMGCSLAQLRWAAHADPVMGNSQARLG